MLLFVLLCFQGHPISIQSSVSQSKISENGRPSNELYRNLILPVPSLPETFQVLQSMICPSFNSIRLYEHLYSLPKSMLLDLISSPLIRFLNDLCKPCIYHHRFLLEALDLSNHSAHLYNHS